MTIQAVTCRFCGHKGYEHVEIDVAPGVCPQCFERLWDSALGKLTASVEKSGAMPARAEFELILLEAGLTEDAIAGAAKVVEAAVGLKFQ